MTRLRRVIAADYGIEHLGLATVKDVDVMVVVVEPSYRSMETARKIRTLATELEIPELGSPTRP